MSRGLRGGFGTGCHAPVFAARGTGAKLGAMDLEFHQLELRYESLRSREPEREKRLLASLAERGQQVPIVVVAIGEGASYAVIDGYKRVRALRRLGGDTVLATRWELGESDALILDRQLRARGRDSVLEEAWLLAELQQRFSLSAHELARRFDRGASWVSRRLGLVRALPLEAQEQVRRGRIVPHAAMKYLLPLARANACDCVRLVAALRRRLSSRELGRLYTAWVSGDAPTRERLLTEPELFLRFEEEASREAPTPSEALIEDLGLLGAIARRAERRLREGAARGLSASRRRVAARLGSQARADVELLTDALRKEQLHAGPDHAHGGAATAGSGPRDPRHRAGAQHLSRSGAADPEGGNGRGPQHQPHGEGGASGATHP
jgi:ParB family chromosome partitioning protein